MSSPVEMKPVHKQALSELVTQQIMGLIQSGNLKPGQQLPPERELAEMFGVSRPSLREALRALALLGLLSIRHGGGVYVSALDPETLLGPLHFFISLDEQNVEALFEARISVEGSIAALAAERITAERLVVLENAVQAGGRNLTDVTAFIEADVVFHQEIFEASRSPILQRVAKSLHLLGRASRSITGRLPGVVARSIEDHRSIFEAIRRRDPAAAEMAMRRHLERVREAYRVGAPAAQSGDGPGVDGRA